ncbi:hypothetical protein M5689_011489 [Euphorbia peplus]|nr:hypothetical protein M5689_011489 [Euphorbia peplus]
MIPPELQSRPFRPYSASALSFSASTYIHLLLLAFLVRTQQQNRHRTGSFCCLSPRFDGDDDHCVIGDENGGGGRREGSLWPETMESFGWRRCCGGRTM